MTIRRVTTALASCAVVLLAGISFTTAASADSGPPTCSSELKTIEPEDLRDPDQWTYTFNLSWCVEGGKIVWAAPEVTHQEHGTTCTWAGRMEESVIAGSEAWTAFDMSEYSCVGGDGKVDGVNPWVEVTFYPSGEYQVRKDIAQ